MAVDLHIHTRASDGGLTPEEVVMRAKRLGLATIAITDHDTVEGVEEALRVGDRVGLEVIPGVEFSTDEEDTEVHILGYYVDFIRDGFVERLRELREARVLRAERILERLRDLGIDLHLDYVKSLSSSDFLGRSQIFQAMIRAGYVDPRERNKAFMKYLGKHGLAYVEHYGITPHGAIELILDAGGVAVLAHPARTSSDRFILELVEHGLGGIEAYYPTFTEKMTQRYLELARRYGLIVTGGSDFHGACPEEGVDIGQVYVPDEVVVKLKLFHRREREKRRKGGIRTELKDKTD